jgi:hypothetical protein
MSYRPSRKIDASITILGDDKGVSIEIEDRDANCVIARVELSCEDFCHAAFGRLGNVPCTAEIGDSEKIGRKCESRKFEFAMPETVDYTNRRDVAAELAVKLCPEGWAAWPYFNSQGSFYRNDKGESVAACPIVRWVDKEQVSL